LTVADENETVVRNMRSGFPGHFRRCSQSAASLDGTLLPCNSVQNIPDITRKPPRGFLDAVRCARSQQRAMT
jgi:hypothetical protein